MADVFPFPGILYNREVIDDPSRVTTPPYDVISEAEQDIFYERHPNNMIRLILQKRLSGEDTDGPRHRRAAESFKEWMASHVLIQDQTPAFYLTGVEFPTGDQKVRRFGLIASVRLEPFSRGIILPHERTFSRVKSERLALMKQCHTNFSPIFSLYSDTEDILEKLKTAALDLKPDMDFTDTAGHRQTLWRITDPDVHEEIQKKMAGKPIFIADGHHRYETALSYRDWLAQKTPGFTEDHPANFIMMYLSSMQDPGLLVLPAHRMIKTALPERRAKMLADARDFFDIESVPLNGAGPKAAGPCMEKIEGRSREHAIGLFMKDQPEYYTLTLKPGVMGKLFGGEIEPELRDLDVTVLTRLLLVRLLGLGEEDLDNERLLTYSSRAEEAVGKTLSGECDMTFLLNPTRIEQVRKVAENRLIMPRKSTYFYPKVITGQVIKSLLP